ncbi:hypothetical protein IMCC1989_2449 [gamma proteobacterium IMCC1989]|nr:hypothetical protein IMCC1989_2449 [gamma proteobacterium IMCC1989]
MKKPTIPFHPLVDEQPADTLAHIQTMLSFAQEFAAKATEDTELTPHEIRIHAGLYALLKVANDALGYEIERLEHDDPLAVVE